MSAEVPTTVHVRYVVPVVAVVDVASRTVRRVVVDDERIRFDDDKVRFETETSLRGAALLAVSSDAIAIAESVTWPRWEFGW